MRNFAANNVVNI